MSESRKPHIELDAKQFFSALVGPYDRTKFTFAGKATANPRSSFGMFVSVGNEHGEEITDRIPVEFGPSQGGVARSSSILRWTRETWLTPTLRPALLFLWDYKFSDKDPLLVYEANVHGEVGEKAKRGLNYVKTVPADYNYIVKPGSIMVYFDEVVKRYPEYVAKIERKVLKWSMSEKDTKQAIQFAIKTRFN